MVQRADTNTKLFPPVSRSRLIDRAHLVESPERRVKLTLVTAPAGFGKTTLLGQLFVRLTRSNVRCCWYSMEYEDNEPRLFLRNCVESLGTVLDGFGNDVLQLLNTTVVEDIGNLLERVAVGIAESDADVALFIDDFHHARSEQILRFVDLLLDLSPPAFRLVIGSRMRPRLSLSNLKLRGELNDITVRQLRFDEQETSAFMCDVLELDLTSKQLSTLYCHSEGWVAGLQLVSLSLHDSTSVDRFIDSFSGSFRDISDYLTDDVLNKQQPDLRDFLLRTSICDRLNADLCDALTDRSNGRELLEAVESNNLFLVPLDYEGKWFRYHHLFQEFLFGQLRRSRPSEIPDLYNRASGWFAESGYVNEAIDYALKAGNIGRVGKLVHAGTMESLAMEGRMAEVLAWVNRIPPHTKVKFPRLLIQESLALAHLCRPLEADEAAIEALASIKELESNADYPYCQQEIDSIRTEAALLPSLVAFAQDDISTQSRTALEKIQTDDELVLGMIENLLGYLGLNECKLEEALQHFYRGRVHHLRKRTYYGAVFSDCFIAMTNLLQYRLHKAYEHLRATEGIVERIPGGHAPGMAKSKVMQAAVLYEWNRVGDAVELLSEHLPVIDAAGHVSITQQGYLTLARCHAAAGEFDQAQRSLTRCVNLSRHKSRSYIELVVHAERIRLAGLCGDWKDLPRMRFDRSEVQSLIVGLQSGWDRQKFGRLLVLLHGAFYAGGYQDVRVVAGSAASLCFAKGLNFHGHKLQLLNLIARLETGWTDAVRADLEQAIAAVCSQGGARLVLDAGFTNRKALEALARSYSHAGRATETAFVVDLLKAQRAGRDDQPSRQTPEPCGGTTALIEPLNCREIEILELLAEGKSNAEIRDRLFISENTVKWHIKNLFAKLGVKNRTAAVVAAQQLKIIRLDF